MAHVGLDYLDRLPASEVPAYAIASLEREAMETLRWIDLFRLPVECWGGVREQPIYRHLAETAQHQLGQAADIDQRSAEEVEVERAAIAEVEAEMARDFPIYLDAERLERTYKQAVLKVA